MSQFKVSCSVTNGSQQVTVAGQDVTYRIHQNDIFMVVNDLVPYVVGATQFNGTDTVIALTGNYLGQTSNNAVSVFANGFTFPDNIPTLTQGDVGTAAIFTQAMYRVQDLLKAIDPSGLGQYTGMWADVEGWHNSVSADAAQVSADAATAASAASSASASATTATTKASEASASALDALGYKTSAQSSASSASASATTATTKASEASTSASASEASRQAAETASSSATSSAYSAAASAASSLSSKDAAVAAASEAGSSALAAQVAKDAALSALDNFDDRYLGAKGSDPTLDNDGNVLTTGALYYNTTSNVMKVFDGAAWRSAYAQLEGALLVSNNLSDVASAVVARQNLGLGNVNNTSDINKPISNATQAALDSLQTAVQGKQDGLVSGSNIKTINGQPLLGSGDIQVAAQSNNMFDCGNSATIYGPEDIQLDCGASV